MEEEEEEEEFMRDVKADDGDVSLKSTFIPSFLLLIFLFSSSIRP